MTFREEYVTVTATLKARTDKAALLEDAKGNGGWVPRSCMHFLTDKAIQNAAIGDEIEGRIMEWIAEQKGLI